VQARRRGHEITPSKNAVRADEAGGMTHAQEHPAR
jgi:hypothetical protein